MVYGWMTVLNRAPAGSSEMAVKVVYFVHDVGDPAIHKRVAMLREGGAEVTVIGFRRGHRPMDNVSGAPVIDLGQTFHLRLGHRATAVLQQVIRAASFGEVVHGADVVLARNLEMLAIAARARYLAAPRSRFVYECLDIHPAMVGTGRKGQALRAVERALLRRCHLLIVSSQAFIDAYFLPRQHLTTPVLLVENKALRLEPGAAPPVATPGRTRPPWRIGWFGVIRAQRALDILARIATENAGLVEIVIRGRPGLAEFRDFHAQVQATPGVSFDGGYTPDDLPAMYADIDFCWAFDYFDEGAGSNWLLPNRLYEGGQFAAIPLARIGTETSRWMQQRGIGVSFKDPAAEVGPWLRAMSPERYEELAQASRQLDRADVVAGAQDCRALVQALAAVVTPAH